MEFKDLIGKTIISATQKKLEKFDDQGFLELKFSDGTQAVILGSYQEDWTGESENEYPTAIGITEQINNLVDLS